MSDGECCLKIGFLTACLLRFAAAVILSAKVVIADTLPYAGDAVLVLDAQNGLVTNGVNVVGWNDLSAGAHHGITNTATSPKLFTRGLNGHDVVQFSGGSSLALAGQVLATQQFTVFALVTDEATNANREILSNWRSDNQGTSVFFGTSGTTTRKVRLTDRIGSNATNALPLNAPTSFSILSGVYNGGGDGQIFQDATLLTNMAVSANRILTTPYTLGVQGAYSSEYWQGKMAQVIVYNRALTTSEHAEVRNYLAQHWASSTSTVSEAMNNFTNLQVWLDASDNATIIQTTNPGYVQCWADKSGHSYDATQFSAASMPATGVATLNGLNLVSFSTNSVADRLNNVTMPALGDSSRTVMFFSQSFDTPNNDIVFGLSYSGGAGTAWGVTDTTVYGKTGPYDVTGLASFGNQGANSYQIMSVTYNNATQKINRYRNGTAVTVNANRSSSAYVTTAGYIVGNWSDSNRAFNGNVGEILIFDRVISEAERIILENHLAARWNPDTPVITLAASSQRYEGYSAAKGNYDRDVWGIGRVNSSTNQLLSGETGTGLRLIASSLGDDDWLLAGHKAATNAILTVGVEPSVKERWSRVWYLDKTDADGSLTATLTFDFGVDGLTAGKAQYNLLYSATDPFAFHSLGSATPVAGQVTFTLAPAQLQDGYYTVGCVVSGTLIRIH